MPLSSPSPRSSSIAAVSVLLLAFSAVASAAPPEPAVERNLADFRIELLDKCPVTSRSDLGAGETVFGALLGVVVPSLVEKGIGLLSGAVHKAAGTNNQSTTVSASHNDYLYKFADDGTSGLKSGCLVAVKGRFGGQPGTDSKLRGALPKDLAPLLEPQLGAMKLVGPPELYFEAMLLSSLDGSAFRVQPTVFYYGASVDGRNGRSARDLAVTFDFGVPGKSDPVGSGQVTMSRVVPGSVYRLSSLQNESTAWMALPSMSDDTKSLVAELARLGTQVNDAIATGNNALPGALAEINTLRKRLSTVQPITAKVTLTETRDLNAWLAAVADALDSTKTELAKTISDAALPQSRKAAETASAVADLQAKQSLAVAKLEVAVAEEALKKEIAKDPQDPEAIRSKEKNLVEKKFAANIKAIEAGEAPPPYTL